MTATRASRRARRPRRGLERLARLRDSGAIPPAEFEREKALLIGSG